MRRGLVTQATVMALAFLFAVPAMAEDLGAPPAGEARPEATSAGAAAPPAAHVAPAAPARIPPGTASPPPPPAWADLCADGASTPTPAPGAMARTKASADAEAVALQRRYVSNPDKETALQRETAATAPCVPQGRVVRGWGGDPMRMRDEAMFHSNAFGGTSISFLPNIGVTLLIGGVYKRTYSLVWSWEAQLTAQFIDDEIFGDDGNPAAGNWWQFDGGVKIASHPNSRRHWTLSWGAVWAYAEGDYPNIVEEKGNHVGAYLGAGFEMDLSCNFTMGPEITGLFLFSESGRFEVVPQFNWHFIWRF